MTTITVEPLTGAAFAPFGQVLEIDAARADMKNSRGQSFRTNELATVTASGTNPRIVITMIRAIANTLPFELKMLERHPFGSQAFMPMKPARFLVVVTSNDGDKPGAPRAFLAEPGQGVNFPAGLWHGPLTALDEQTDFVVVDRLGDEPNADTFHFPEPIRIEA